MPSDEIRHPAEAGARKRQAGLLDLPAEQSAPQPERAAADAAGTGSAPDNSQQAAGSQPQTRTLRVRAAAPGPAAKARPSIFDPANIPMLLDLPNAPEQGFDAESTTAANLSVDERAAFKAHLRKCWKLPGGASPQRARASCCGSICAATPGWRAIRC